MDVTLALHDLTARLQQLSVWVGSLDDEWKYRPEGARGDEAAVVVKGWTVGVAALIGNVNQALHDNGVPRNTCPEGATRELTSLTDAVKTLQTTANIHLAESYRDVIIGAIPLENVWKVVYRLKPRQPPKVFNGATACDLVRALTGTMISALQRVNEATSEGALTDMRALDRDLAGVIQARHAAVLEEFGDGVGRVTLPKDGAQIIDTLKKIHSLLRQSVLDHRHLKDMYLANILKYIPAVWNRVANVSVSVSASAKRRRHDPSQDAVPGATHKGPPVVGVSAREQQRAGAFLLLGLAENSTPQDATTAWRHLSLKVHPDKQSGISKKEDAKNQFLALTAAKDLVLRWHDDQARLKVHKTGVRPTL